MDDAVAVELQRPQWRGQNAVHGLATSCAAANRVISATDEATLCGKPVRVRLC